MITESEARIIFDHACVPEHVPAYVTAVSGAEPFFSSGYLYYVKADQLTFIGYPLAETPDATLLEEAMNRAIRERRPAQVAVIAAHTPSLSMKAIAQEEDDYFRITLLNWKMPQKVRNMVHRSAQEVNLVEEISLGEEHKSLIALFLEERRTSAAMRFIFARIAEYVALSPTARVFSARDRENRMVAFDVAELGARDYVFYMFNFRDPERPVPGVSDLLLHEIVKKAEALGKPHVNLGLGVNRGIRFFKKKWGGRPFLSYRYGLYGATPVRSSLLNALRISKIACSRGFW
jgi:hypothetical protein